MARTDYGLGGVYNASPITLGDGQGSQPALNSSGQLVVAGPTGSSSNAIQGSAADNAAAVGNPVRNGAVYNSSTQTYASGDISDLQSDVNGNLRVTQGTLLAGEDLTNNRMMTMPKYTYSAVAVADAQIKASAGVLHSVTISCNDAAPTAGSIIIFDNTAESGTQVFNHTFTATPFVPFTVNLDYNMLTGIYIGFTTTADVNCSVAYL